MARDKNMSQLDYLWTYFGNYKVSEQVSGNPSDENILTEKALIDFLNASVLSNKVVSTILYRPSSTKGIMEIVGIDAQGTEITSVEIPEEVHVSNFEVRLITQNDIDKGITIPLDTKVLSLTLNNESEFIVSLEDLNLKILGYESDTILTDVINNTVKADLKINEGNNTVSVVKLRKNNNGVYGDLEISPKDTGVSVVKQINGLEVSIPLKNTTESLKFMQLTLDQYLGLNTKDLGTVYFITDKPYIYLSNVKYGFNVDQDKHIITGLQFDSEQNGLIVSYLDQEDVLVPISIVSESSVGLMTPELYQALQTCVEHNTSIDNYTVNGQKISENPILDKTHIGLNNVDNTSDLDKPISTVTQEALNQKVDKIEGKQLSTEDYTTEEKDKLSGIEDNANNYTHPTTTGFQHIPTGGDNRQLLQWKSDGIAKWTTISSSSQFGTLHYNGTEYQLVPVTIMLQRSNSPESPMVLIKGTENNQLILDIDSNLADEELSGFMSSEDKIKLDNLVEVSNSTQETLTQLSSNLIGTVDPNSQGSGEIFNDSSNTAPGQWAHAEGYETTASGKASHTEGRGTQASNTCAHAEGYQSIASGYASHAEGYTNTATGDASHVEGRDNEASGQCAHAEGGAAKASEFCAHAEGYKTQANGYQAHAEGYYSIANGGASHAEGGGLTNVYLTGDANTTTYTILADSSWLCKSLTQEELLKYFNQSNLFICNYVDQSYTLIEITGAQYSGDQIQLTLSETLSADSPLSEQKYGILRHYANGGNSHIEGLSNFIDSESGFSHIEGNDNTIINSESAHIEGSLNFAINGDSSHIEGSYNIAQNFNEHAQGMYNKSNTGDTDDKKTLHSIGIGTKTTRKNAQEVMINGDHYIIGIGGYDGTNPETAKSVQEVIAELQAAILTLQNS